MNRMRAVGLLSEAIEVGGPAVELNVADVTGLYVGMPIEHYTDAQLLVALEAEDLFEYL